MRRKIIQLAGKTLIVSLPSKWVKKHGIKKGEEIELEEEGRRLIIKSEGKGEKTTKFLDAKDLNLVLNKTIGGLYKAGYDEIEITYYSPKQYSVIRDVLNKTCMGYEIIRHGQRTILIRNLSELHSQEFENLLRRLFLTLLSSAEDALEYIKESNFKGMEEIVLRDPLINKYSDLCRRILNLKGHENTKKTTSYYYICENLEKTGDGYKDLMQFMVDNKIKKLDKFSLGLMAEINRYLRLFYELFYKFSLKGLEEFESVSAKIKKDFQRLFETTSIKEIRLNYHIYIIFSRIFDMNSSLIVSSV